MEDRQKRVSPISPNRIFQQEYSDKVLNDAKRLADILSQIEKSFRWDSSKPIKLGILNGYARDQTTEKPCSEYVWSYQQRQFWKDYFSELKRDGSPKFQVQEISTSEITEEFAAILNPFGEAYPEYSVDDRETYNQIKLFIEHGGVFVNTAGFAFFYAWDVKNGGKKPISEERIFLPVGGNIQQGMMTITQLQEMIRFTGTLFYKDFGASTTYDITSHVGTHRVETFQTLEDRKKFGDLGIKTVNEFRALRKETHNCVPILRANCPIFGEIYPICAINFGRGFIIVSGMSMTTREEATVLVNAIDHFCDWISSEFA